MMKVTYIGDGRLDSVFSFPGGKLRRGESLTFNRLPAWLDGANPGAFLLDGKPYVKPKPPKPAAKPDSKPAPKENHG